MDNDKIGMGLGILEFCLLKKKESESKMRQSEVDVPGIHSTHWGEKSGIRSHFVPDRGFLGLSPISTTSTHLFYGLQIKRTTRFRPLMPGISPIRTLSARGKFSIAL
jgi:hypothetical protein